MSLRERAAALEGVDLLDESEVEVLPGEQIVRIPKTEISATRFKMKNLEASKIEVLA